MNVMAQAELLETLLRQAPVLPVISLSRLEEAVPLARTLVVAGLPVLEITLRHACALEAMRRISAEVPEAIIGAGTVLTATDLQTAAAAGAAFAVSPGATETLYSAAAQASIPWLPAVASAGELMRGREHGYRHFKFFPAQSTGGVNTLKAWLGPFPDARFCPTGGIDATNAREYLALPNVLTIGGSWMVPPALLAEGAWERIGELARQCAALTLNL